MKKYLLTIIALLVAHYSFSQFPGFENGNFNSFDMSYGTNVQSQKQFLWMKWCVDEGISGETSGVSSPVHHKIMDNTIASEQFDPAVGGTVLPTVIEGRYSARLGSKIRGSIAQRLKKTLVINSQNSNFKLNYALVTFDPMDHNDCEKPYFEWSIKTVSGFTFICKSYVKLKFVKFYKHFF